MYKFIEISFLTPYAATLLNRDESGSAKRLPYGGDVRTRIASQCLKRHWRIASDQWALANTGIADSVRSKEIVERRILPELNKATTPEIASGLGDALIKRVYGKKALDMTKRQALLIGEPEISYLTKIVLEVAADSKDPADAEKKFDDFWKGSEKSLTVIRDQVGNIPGGLVAALFGRMVTSDTEANIDAPIHVAHAFTTHREEVESDYFTAVDDLRQDAGEQGSAGIFDTEITSGLFYGYVVIDIEMLVSNLGGDREIASKVVEHLVHLIATVSPGAKKGSTAPYSYADLLLVEGTNRQPRSLAKAFRKAIPLAGELDVSERSAKALVDHLTRIDTAYGAHSARHALSTLQSDIVIPGVAKFEHLDDVAKAAAGMVNPQAVGA